MFTRFFRLIDGAGYLWGTISTGGAVSRGTVFKIHAVTGTLTTAGDFCATIFKGHTATHQFTTVVQFSGTSSSFPGRFPQAPLVRTASGEWWGTTVAGGSAGTGTVFTFNPGAFATQHQAGSNAGTTPARGACPPIG